MLNLNFLSSSTTSFVFQPLTWRIIFHCLTPLLSSANMRIGVYGYLLDEEAVLRNGLRKGLGTAEDMYARSDTIVKSFMDIAARGGVFGYSRWVCVLVKGESRRCIALANNDPYDPLPLAPRDRIDALKTFLKTDKEPRWYIYEW
ncbi:hypothetical protein Hypma_011877 [Hypsizygus marmoreus]|uniref:Uncharacterized protein n=1 Tax=Hypsizygus marmoreus TaxID=39966 RepID=A0A369JP31_HYPMA|nr:hypothetical protein Hypma_011877 [Hypsizygus marmoreus]